MDELRADIEARRQRGEELERQLRAVADEKAACESAAAAAAASAKFEIERDLLLYDISASIPTANADGLGR